MFGINTPYTIDFVSGEDVLRRFEQEKKSKLPEVEEHVEPTLSEKSKTRLRRKLKLRPFPLSIPESGYENERKYFSEITYYLQNVMIELTGKNTISSDTEGKLLKRLFYTKLAVDVFKNLSPDTELEPYDGESFNVTDVLKQLVELLNQWYEPQGRAPIRFLSETNEQAKLALMSIETNLDGLLDSLINGAILQTELGSIYREDFRLLKLAKQVNSIPDANSIKVGGNTYDRVNLYKEISKWNNKLIHSLE